MSHHTPCRRKRRAMSQMNVVPYIDVMLVLLVIFMVTAPMMQAGVQVDAPEASAEPLNADNQQEPLTVSVDKTGQYFLDDGSETNSEGITQYLAGKLGDKGERPVYVKADKTAEYRYLVGAMVAAQQAGAKKISLVVDAAPTPDKP
jgi:biopolymer transport protein TolR